MQDAIRIEDHALQRGGVQDVLRRRNLQDHLQHSQRMRQAVKLEPAAAPPAARPRTPPPPTPPPAITEALCPQCGLCTGEPRCPRCAAPMEAALAAWRAASSTAGQTPTAPPPATPPAATPPPQALRVDDMARVLSMLNSTDEMIRTHLTPRGGNTPRAAEAAAAAESLAALLVTLPSAPLDDDLADDCHVCLQPMRAGEDARALPCIHRFHRECIDRWLAVKRVCPSCKFDVSARGAES